MRVVVGKESRWHREYKMAVKELRVVVMNSLPIWCNLVGDTVLLVIKGLDHKGAKSS